jgi:hypothetical protein
MYVVMNGKLRENGKWIYWSWDTASGLSSLCCFVMRGKCNVGAAEVYRYRVLLLLLGGGGGEEYNRYFMV